MTAGVVSDDSSVGQYRSIFNEGQQQSEGGEGVMVQSVNHATGHNTWRMMPADYDYNQELARAAFADMLHDWERNRLYYEGLEAAIKLKRSQGKEVHVLDIGTGTGLLSMMAARLGADTITACEEFRPMAECAVKVIADNGYTDKIKLVRKRSTELQVGPGLDMERRANILVTEVFDTELIGEGAISTYNHAAKHLLTDDRLVVPGVARIWAQVVRSDKCRDWSVPRPLTLDTDNVLAPVPGHSGHTSLSLHDVQLSQFSPDQWTPLTPPTIVFSMDLTCRDADIPETDRSVTRLTSLDTGHCDAVLMWWDCWTDPAHTILLSCAPRHASHHPADQELPWRDHWMQAIYYPSSDTRVTRGEPVSLVACHDEYSLWFDVVTSPPPPSTPISLPSPQPGLNLAMSRNRLGQVNNKQRNSQLARHLKRLVSEERDKTILVISEQSLLGLMAAKLGVRNVIHICESNNYMRDYISQCSILNNIHESLSLETVDWLASADVSNVSAVIAEPHFTVSVLPWHNLLFWFIISKLELSPSVKISPCKARLFMMPVHFVDLWKIRAPLHKVEGFEMKHFDKIIEAASEISDNNVEPQPLWEYPSIALSQPVQVCELDLTKKVPTQNLSFSGECSIEDCSRLLNGVALWMEWSLDEGSDNVLSGGPVIQPTVGSAVKWDMDSKQGVSFFQKYKDCTKLQYHVEFVPSEGDFTFKFKQL